MLLLASILCLWPRLHYNLKRHLISKISLLYSSIYYVLYSSILTRETAFWVTCVGASWRLAPFMVWWASHFSTAAQVLWLCHKSFCVVKACMIPRELKKMQHLTFQLMLLKKNHVLRYFVNIIIPRVRTIGHYVVIQWSRPWNKC